MNPLNYSKFLDLCPPKLIGASFMLLWALSFSTAMAVAKTLSPGIDSVVLLFMRFFFGFLFFSPFIAKVGFKGFTTSRPILHLSRVILISLAVACTYYAYRNLPLAIATSIGMTGPLFTTIFAMLILKDNVSLSKWGLIILGYFGVLVIVRPHELPISMGVWVELCANTFAAMAIICTKILSRTEKTFTIMLYANTFTTVISGILAYCVWKTPVFNDVLILMVVGALGVFSQYCNVSALKHADPSFLAPFEYTRMCFAIPVGFMFFDEVPTLWVIVGSLIIIGATYGLTREMKPSKKALAAA